MKKQKKKIFLDFVSAHFHQSTQVFQFFPISTTSINVPMCFQLFTISRPQWTRMDAKWSWNNFLLGSSSLLVNHGG
jgi:hypothetical protein